MFVLENKAILIPNQSVVANSILAITTGDGTLRFMGYYRIIDLS